MRPHCLAASALALSALNASAQNGPRPDLTLLAIRCDLHTSRYPDTLQPMYFYLSDTRRNVFETDGSPLGNVAQYTPQRIVVTKNGADGSVRNYTFDRMIGSLTVTGTVTTASNTREAWTLTGECQKVDASKQKF
jgi:hypothetical protein